MRYLKNFNEELNPSTYIKAGKKLIGYGKTKKGVKLTDLGYEQKWGLYKVLFKKRSHNLDELRSGYFTNPICNFHYGLPRWNSNSTIVKSLETAEELVEDWKQGGSLCFHLDFRFTPTEQFYIDNPGLSHLKNELWGKVEGKNSQGIQLFSYKVELSHWTDGLDGWNYDEEEEMPIRKDDQRYSDLNHLYEFTKQLNIKLVDNWDVYHGVFGDRQSALKFKRLLPELVRRHVGEIMDILSIVGGTSDDLENIVDEVYNFSINRIFLNEEDKREFRKLL